MYINKAQLVYFKAIKLLLTKSLTAGENGEITKENQRP